MHVRLHDENEQESLEGQEGKDLIECELAASDLHLNERIDGVLGHSQVSVWVAMLGGLFWSFP